jgi:hypothetical protein
MKSALHDGSTTLRARRSFADVKVDQADWITLPMKQMMWVHRAKQAGAAT